MRSTPVPILVTSFYLVLVGPVSICPGAPNMEPWIAACWNMQEGQADALHDESRYGNDGEIHGAAWVHAGREAALRFTPDQRSHVEVPQSQSLDLAAEIRIDVQVKTYGPTGQWQGIIAKRSDVNQAQKVQYQLALRPDLELSYCVNVGGSDDWWYPGTGIRLEPNRWYAVSAVYDPVLRQVRLSVDDKLLKTLEHAPVVRPSDNPVHIGWTGWADEYLNGELRQIRITDPTAERIADLRRRGIDHGEILSAVCLPHRFRTGGDALGGVVEAVLLNPRDQAAGATLRVKTNQQTVEVLAEMPAGSRSAIRCVVSESPLDVSAQVELIESGQTVATQGLTIAGSASALGFQAYVVSHTHSDFAWADSMPKCLDANVAAVGRSVELAEKNPDYRFTMEHVLAVREYLRRNPEKLTTVRQLMHDGRFEVGGFYTGPWELTGGSEALVRQLYLGKLWVKKNLAVDPTTVWNVDVAGHTAQLPQILSKAGIRGLVISAGSEGPNLFNWQARDGSGVLTWSTPWGYGAGNTLGLRNESLADLADTMPRFFEEVRENASRYQLPKIAFIAEGTDIQSPTPRVVENIRKWNTQGHYPPMVYASTTELFAKSAGSPVPSSAGEMPSPWDSVQAQGNECFMADRVLDGRLLAAEKLAAFTAALLPAFKYPHERFETVWENRLLASEHNWGGTHGPDSNRLKTEKIREATALTEQTLTEAFTSIVGVIRFQRADVPRVLVFNPLSWDRRDVVACELPMTQSQAARLVIVDGDDRPVPHQVASSGRASPGHIEIIFRADVPSLGYATYYLTKGEPADDPASVLTTDPNQAAFESPFYRVQLDASAGGIKSIRDKRTGRELVRPDSRYMLNELLAYEDDAVDIGLHLTGRQWSARQHPSGIHVLEHGPVRMVIEVSGKLLDNSSRRQQIVLYADLPRIDLITCLDWEGQRNVHVYQAFPLNMRNPSVRYAVPYGWEEYGSEMKYAAPWPFGPVAGYRWRGVRGWIELAEAGQSITLASQCNDAAFRDLSANPEDGYLIQPLLLRTVRSCGDEQLYYHQKGSHEFRFRLAAQADSARLGEELDSPLLAFVTESQSASAPLLPDRLAFVRIEPENIHVAVAKQAEDGRGLILRLVETKERQRPTEVALRLFRALRDAIRTDIVEQDGQQLPLRDGTAMLSIAPAGIETMRASF